jgi:hypothetical protein
LTPLLLTYLIVCHVLRYTYDRYCQVILALLLFYVANDVKPQYI